MNELEEWIDDGDCRMILVRFWCKFLQILSEFFLVFCSVISRNAIFLSSFCFTSLQVMELLSFAKDLY